MPPVSQPRAPRPGGHPDEETDTFLDRGPALRALEDALEAVCTERALKIVTVGADAGLGKTRLLTEFRRSLAGRTGGSEVLTAYGAAVGSQSTNAGYDVVCDALIDMVRQSYEKDSSLLRRVGGAIVEVAPDWLATVPVVGSILQASMVTWRTAAAHEPTLSPSLNSQLLALLRALSAQCPVVVFLDDLHWADQSTVDLLTYLSQKLDGPVLLVLAFRENDLDLGPHAHPLKQALWRIERAARVDHIALEPLSGDSQRKLMKHHCRILPPAAVAPISLVCGGNPLFIAQWTLHLDDVTRAGRSWSEALAHIPRSLHALLSDRLADLDDDELNVLQAAAVLGDQFSIDDVVGVCGAEAGQTRRTVRSLCQRRALLHPLEVKDRYAFQHNLLAEHVRRELEGKDRYYFQFLHQRCAELLEQRDGAAPLLLERAAFHWHTSGTHDKALEVGRAAAESACSRGALAEAVRFLGWARDDADAVAATEASIEIRLRMAAVQQEMIRTDEAVETLEQARRLTSSTSAPALLTETCSRLARTHRMAEDWASAARYLEAALGTTDDGSPAWVALRLLAAEIAMCGHPRDLDRAEAILTGLIRHEATPSDRAGIVGHLGFVHLARERLDEARACFAQASVAAAESRSPGRRYEAALWTMKLHIALMELPQARRLVTEMAQISEDSGVALTVAHHCRDTGRVALLEGNVAEAASAYVSYLLPVVSDRVRMSRAAAYLVLQVRESLDQRDKDETLDFLDLLSRQVADAPTIVPIFNLVEEMLYGLSNGLSLTAALSSPESRSLLGTPQARATDVIFRFHIHNLADFRQRHATNLSP